MRYYMSWGQVQQHLTDHYHRTGTPLGFADAVRQLWEEGRYERAERFPEIPFEDWDSEDLDALEALLDQMPVHLGVFHRDYEDDYASSIPEDEEVHTDPDIVVYRIACHQTQGIHLHDAFEIDYVVRGTARLILGGASRALPGGTLCLISSRAMHEAVADEGCLLLSVMLSRQNIENTLFRLLQNEGPVMDFLRYGFRDSRCGYILFNDVNRRDALPLFRGLLHEFYNNQAYTRDACANYLELLFIRLLRQSWEYYHDQRDADDAMPHGAIPMLPILRYIQANYATTSLNAVSRRFHYDPTYLGKKIRDFTGKSYRDIVNELRMDAARRLLLRANVSIEEAARATGFDSAANFSRRFHALQGVSPSQWRREVLRNQKTENDK